MIPKGTDSNRTGKFTGRLLQKMQGYPTDIEFLQGQDSVTPLRSKSLVFCTEVSCTKDSWLALRSAPLGHMLSFKQTEADCSVVELIY